MYLLKNSVPSIMALLTLIGCYGKFSSAFAPTASRRLLSSPTKYKGEPGKGFALTRGFRRARPTPRMEDSIAFVKNLQKKEGKYMDFQDGCFPLAVSKEASSDVFTDEFVEKMDDMGGFGPQLPHVFPFEGVNEKLRESTTRMRFAPSPTGSLHVGGARTALYNWLLAKKGQLDYPESDSGFVLRVEDTDLARSTKESEKSVLDDLRWLGLTWDEGPDNEEAKYGPYRQSERNNLYKMAASRLLEEGKAYRCFCTPEELDEMKAQQEAAGLPTRYDGRWRDAPESQINKMLDAGKPFTIRFKVPEGVRIVIEDAVRGTVSWDAEATVGDFIILRSNKVPVYNFCVALDDALMAITTVVRAEEHLTNTVRQALVLDALGAPRPRYAHCSLILGEDKQKLSKRHGATSCNQFRLDGFLPDAMINYLALLGWADGSDNEIFTRDELIDAFELERVVKSPSVFDMEKLKWINSQHLKMLKPEQLLTDVKEQFEWEGLLREGLDLSDEDEELKVAEFILASTSIAKQMMETTKDAATNAQKILGYNLPESFEGVTDPEAKSMIERGNFYPLIQRVLQQYDANEFPTPNPAEDDCLAAFTDASGKALEKDNEKGENCVFTKEYIAHLKKLAKEMKLKGKNFFHPIRLALTGEMSGQDVTKQLSLLAMASAEDSVINKEKVEVVDLNERMERLRSFIETIPEEFREPRKEETKKSGGGKNENAKQTAGGSSTSAETSSSSAVADPLDTYEGPPVTALDIRVGRVTKVWEHPEADKLYCEEIDVGEEEPRQIASGLKPYLKPEDIEGKKVLVLCNLKARKLVGFPSHGMVLCASNEDHSVVKLVNPPVDAKIGERVTIPDIDYESEEGQPFAENKIGKKKVFEKLAPFLVTSKYGVPEFCGRPFMTSAGVCTSPIIEGTVS